MAENEKTNEIEHIFRNSQLGSGNFTEEGLTEAYVEILAMLEEIQQYRTIGTVEECRETRERQKEKKPKHQGCYDSKDVWHEWNGINGRPYELCPNCGTNLCCEMPHDRKPQYCDNCGQKLNWAE